MLARLAAVAIVAGLVAGCSADDRAPPATQMLAAATAPSVSIPADRWRTVLVAGDNSSPAFDNGIDTLRERLVAMGVRHIAAYSASPARTGQLSTVRNVESALSAGGGEACFVYMTSHGDERGFFLRPDRRLLGPAALDQALTAGCGDRP